MVNPIQKEMIDVLERYGKKEVHMYQLRKDISVNKQAFDTNFLALLKEGIIEIPDEGIWLYHVHDAKLLAVGVLDPKNKKKLYTSCRMNPNHKLKEADIRKEMPRTATPIKPVNKAELAAIFEKPTSKPNNMKIEILEGMIKK